MKEFACETAIVAASGDDVVEERVEVWVNFGEFDDAVDHAEAQPEARGQQIQRPHGDRSATRPLRARVGMEGARRVPPSFQDF